MTRIVVVGAGLTGLVACERLAAAGAGVLLLERETEVGGACRSTESDGFVFDHTGHLLHVSRSEPRAYLRELGVWEGLAEHERRAAVVVGGRVTPYPIQIHTHGLAPEVRRDCLLGFIRAWAGSGGDEARTFRDWVLARFGDGLARHFFFPYNSKLYRAAPEELSLEWVGRYVPKPDLEAVVDGALGLHRGPVGYNATFRYPRRGGIRLLPDAVAARLPEVSVGAEVAAFNLRERWLELSDGTRVGYDRLVSTISLSRLIDGLVDELADEVVEARRRLRWVKVLNVALGVRGAAPSPEHWLYFPDPELPFYRVGFPSNHGDLAPAGCHTVSIEVSLDPQQTDIERLADEAEEAAARAGLVDRGRVLTRAITVIDPAYVVFDAHRRSAVARLRRLLSTHGVLIAGRWAEWKYSAMEDAILDGMRVARQIAGKAS